ncbi:MULTISPECIES: helix-turn-helix domain-containing protein [Acidobacteriaceae]|uniref:winged helix-turn-helix transcriptional regulator n=1 Tax=Acidobacteriaceae TaxID=204434 RepID=UPI00131BA6BE|nr:MULTISPECIES: helix-turn-helix domain-containing protein [Acidobacteriaceae]MDW5266355.1 helix-turn-helix domain-containing protein [Edaphobacter sp.]
MPVSKKEISACPIDAMLSVIDGRWKGTILWRLSEGPMRTSELHRTIPGITQRMLIRHLQELVQNGILVRHQERSMPPCVRYSISKYGLTLLPVLEEICKWGRNHLRICAKTAISMNRLDINVALQT